MKTSRLLTFCLSALLMAGCGGEETPKKNTNNENKGTNTNTNTNTETTVTGTLTANPATFNGTKIAGTTYQILVYSFCDSDGDGVGDFNGITSKLDYLDELGVTALWLSPIHPSMSYHGYDVTDYNTVNPLYGTESDFQNLVNKAKAKGIDIYLDYVLNHSGVDHPYFKDAAGNKSSEYRDYYIFSEDPKADITAGNIAMIATEGSNGYDSGQWFAASAGVGYTGRLKFVLNTSSSKPTITVTETDEDLVSGTSSVGWNVYYGNDKTVYFSSTGSNTYEAVIDFESEWGFLIRKAANWNTGSKYGAQSSNPVVTFGTAFTLYPSTSSFDPANITFAQPEYYHSHFWTSWFADWNYGDASTASTSGAFKYLAATADKWINMGVKGLRLDAVKHIYHNGASDENGTFLKQWYDHCNATYKAAGNTDEMYMVGEVLNEVNASEAPYKKYLTGLPSVFNFSFWWRLSEAINNANASSFVKTIIGYNNVYKNTRADAVISTKLSNHDEDRTGSVLGGTFGKERVAMAILLTAEGKPYIYQGEELGYTGTKGSGDEYVRNPIYWSSSANYAAAGVNNKVDASLKTSAFSVETQDTDASSLLNAYRTFAKLRNTYPALANGTMSACESISNSSVAAWYMTDPDSGDKLLVIHNVSTSDVSVSLSDDVKNTIGVLGTAFITNKLLTLSGYASVVFEL